MNLENQAPVDLLESKVLKDPLVHQALKEHPAERELMELLEIQGSKEIKDPMELMDVMEHKGQEDQLDPEENQVPQVSQDLPQREKEG